MVGFAARAPRRGRARTRARTARRPAHDSDPLRAQNRPPRASPANRKRALSLEMMAAAFSCAISAAALAAASRAAWAMALQPPHRSLRRSRDAALKQAQYARTGTAEERKLVAIGCQGRACVCAMCVKNIFLCARGEKVGVRD